MSLISVVTAPAAPAATLSAVKGHLRVDATDDDDYITSLISAAEGRVQEYTGRRLITQTLELHMGAEALARAIPMPVAPVTAVASVEVETAGGTETVDAGDYELVAIMGEAAGPGFIRLMPDKHWPGATISVPHPVRIRVTAGYGGVASLVPAGLRQAMYTMVAGWYEGRQDIVQGAPPGTYAMPMVSESIMEPYRLLWAV